MPAGPWVFSAAAQNQNVSIFVRMKEGFLAVDELKTKPFLSGSQRPADGLRRRLIEDVNRILRDMGRLCTQAFDLTADANCPPESEPIAHLTTHTWEDAKLKWQTWQASDQEKRKSLAGLFSLDSGAIVGLEERLPLATGLAFDSSDVAALDFASGMLTFKLTPFIGGQEPVSVVDAGEGPRLATDAQIQAAMKRLTGVVLAQAGNRNLDNERVPRTPRGSEVRGRRNPDGLSGASHQRGRDACRGSAEGHSHHEYSDGALHRR